VEDCTANIRKMALSSSEEMRRELAMAMTEVGKISSLS
jgi:hypothetical protein